LNFLKEIKEILKLQILGNWILYLGGSATQRLSLRQGDGNNPFFSGVLEKWAAR
jgi:hypothetical protein